MSNSYLRDWSVNPKYYNWYICIIIILFYTICYNISEYSDIESSLITTIFEWIEEFATILLVVLICLLMMNVKNLNSKIEELTNKIEELKEKIEILQRKNAE